jgi:hypothetical protein
MGNYLEVGINGDASMAKVSGCSTRDVLMKLWDAGFTPTQRTSLYDIVTSY